MDKLTVEMADLIARLKDTNSPTQIADFERLWELVMGAPIDRSRPMQDALDEMAVMLKVRFGESAPTAPKAERSRYQRAVAWLDGSWPVERWLVIGTLLAFGDDLVPWQTARGGMAVCSITLLVRGAWKMLRRR